MPHTVLSRSHHPCQGEARKAPAYLGVSKVGGAPYFSTSQSNPWRQKGILVLNKTSNTIGLQGLKITPLRIGNSLNSSHVQCQNCESPE